MRVEGPVSLDDLRRVFPGYWPRPSEVVRLVVAHVLIELELAGGRSGGRTMVAPVRRPDTGRTFMRHVVLVIPPDSSSGC